MSISIGTRLRHALIFVHRWLGVALCLLFLLWFPSGIGMMYWDFPSVTAADRLERSPALDRVHSPAVAGRSRASRGTGRRRTAFGSTRSTAGRSIASAPAGDDAIVYADTGESRQRCAEGDDRPRWRAALDRQAVRRRGSRNVEDSRSVDGAERSAASSAAVEVLVAERRAGLRLAGDRRGGPVHDDRVAMGRVPRRDPALDLLHAAAKARPQWSRVVIWSSGIGTHRALLGIVIGVWMYSPSKRYRYAGAPTSIPYRGQKRWHTIFGLIFGLGAATWAFSGMLSMDPFPAADRRGQRRPRGVPDIPQALARRGSPPGGVRTPSIRARRWRKLPAST